MGRRTSGQTVGLQTIGNVQASAATLTTTQANQNLALDPNGSGAVDVFASVTVNGDMSIANQGDLRLLEASGNGTNYIAMQAAANMAANYTITWPAAVAATNGFVLTSDTSGNLSWVNAGGNIPVNDPGASATVHYPLFGTASGSVPTTLSPLARSNLAFIPSTGELTATAGNFANVYGSTANSGTIVIRGTSSATKSTASVLMSDGVASSSTTTGTLVVTGGVGVSGQVTSTDLLLTNSPVYPRTENVQTASYQLALSDRNRTVIMNSGSATTVTIPADGTVNFPVGSLVYITRVGSGAVTLAAAGGVTVNKTGTLAPNEEILVRKRSANTWIVIDDSDSPLTASGGTLVTASGFNRHTFGTGTTSFVVS
jgi:hypothetical protein